MVQYAPEGTEFQVNSTWQRDQENSSITALSDGGFVVTWTSELQDGSGDGVYAQRYDAWGTLLGGEFRVNGTTSSHQSHPSVAALSDGGFVVSWMSYLQDGSGWGIFAQRYDANGNVAAGEFQVNGGPSGDQSYPSVTALGLGGFVVSWMDGSAIHWQLYDSGGAPMGSELLVSFAAPIPEDGASVAALSDGGFLVSWVSYADIGYSLHAQRYDLWGTSIGGEFQVNSTTASDVYRPSITGLADGGFVVSWVGYPGNPDANIYAQRYDAGGVPLGDEFQVNSGESYPQRNPSVAALSDGGFVVSWMTFSGDGSGWGVFAQAYDANGDPQGTEFLVNSNTTHHQQDPSITGLSDGGFVVSWTSFSGDGSGRGIFAQSYMPLENTAPVITSDGGGDVAAIVMPENYVPVTVVEAEDPDGGPLFWSIAGGDDAASFEIDAGTGVLNFVSAPDFESPADADGDNIYDVVVRVSDGTLFDEQALTVTIDNVPQDLSVHRLGDEFQVNSTALGEQQTPWVTGLSDGGFVVTWMSYLQDGDGWGIYAQRYDVGGAPVGGEFQVNSTSAKDQGFSAIEALGDGGFVVTWLATMQDDSGYGIFAQRYDAAGAPAGGEFQVNSGSGADGWPVATALSDGGFVISWTEQDGDGPGIYAQRYDAGSAPVGSAFLVNSTTAGLQHFPSIAALSDGGFVLCWTFSLPDGSNGIAAQRYDAGGTPIGGEFQANSVSSIGLTTPSIAGLADGGFVISWVSQLDWSIIAQRFDANGSAFGGEFYVGTSGNQSSPSVTALSGGGFVISWMAYDETGNGIFAQAYGADNDPQGMEFLVSSAASEQQAPSISALEDGGFVVSWMSSEQDGDGWGIYAQRYAVAQDNGLILSNDSVSETAIENIAVASLSMGGFSPDPIDYEILADSTGGAFGIDGDELIVVDSSKLDFETAAQVEISIRGTNSNGVSTERTFTLSVLDETVETRLSAGDAFQVNGATFQERYEPSVAALGDGGIVVIWQSWNPDDGSFGIFAQRYDANGGAAGGEFRVSGTASTYQFSPSITALSDGGFVASWMSYGQDGSGSGVYAQRYDANGAALGGEWQVNSTTAEDQFYPSIAALSDGGFVVSWMSYQQDGSSNGIYAQRYDASGAAVGGEFRVNSTTASDQLYPSVTALSDGGFVVSWTSYGQDGSDGGIYAQRYDASGAAVGGEFRVNSTTLGDQSVPSIAALTDGGFLVCWTSYNEDGIGDVYAQRYDAGGAAAGGEFRVNTTTYEHQSELSVTALSDGGFVVSWTSFDQPGSSEPAGEGPDDVFAQRYDANGAPVGGEFRVNGPTWGDHFSPSITALGNGGFAVTWISSSPEESGSNVYARTFTADAGANSAPLVASPIADQSSAEDAAWSFAVPANTFFDLDGDALAYAASLDNGDPLPSWLSFDDASLTFNGTPPADFHGVIALTVTASDGDLSASDAFELTIAPVNDAPVITSDGGGTSAALSLPENGTAVTTVTAFDVDGDDLIYSVAGGNDAALFAIDPETGILTFITAPDFENPADFAGDNFYTVAVAASDGTQAVTQSIEILVTNVNEGVTITSNGGGDNAALAIAENGTAVTIIEADDIDGDTLLYSITGGADAALFQIDGSTGALSFIAAPDFEAPGDAGGDGTYDVVVRASDGSFSDSQALSIAITNVNEGVTITSNGGGDTAALNVAENGTAVTTVQANDMDGDALIYSITGGADAALFQINGSTGALSFIAAPNFEAPGDASGDGIYDVVVRASDGSLFDNQALAVTVTNLIEPRSYSGTSRADTFTAPADGDWTVDGKAGNDVLTTANGFDTVVAGSGNDVIATLGGDDLITFTGSANGYDSINGGAGFDELRALAANTVISIGSVTGIELISANGHANVSILGTTAADMFDFSTITLNGITLIDLGAGNDNFIGSAGADAILGGNGADFLSGGLGADVFSYRLVGESKGTTIDRIADFLAGEDLINLSLIDANTKVSGNQGFSFIGSEAFHKVAGELRAVYDAASDTTRIFGDTNGDAKVDFELHLTGAVPLGGTDFIL